MKKERFVGFFLVSMFLIICLPLQAATTVTIQADQPGAQIAPTFIGLFIEDINFNGDGGLYDEKIKNRSFEFPDAMMGWGIFKEGAAEGTAVAIHKKEYDPADASCLRIEVKEAGGGFGVSNEGYRGIGIKKGQKYYFTVFAKTDEPAMSLKVEVVGADGRKVLEGSIDTIKGDWENYTCLMEAKGTEAKGRLNVLAGTKGTVDLDMISLFPEESSRQMNGRPVPGLRKDLVEMLAAVRPGFLRFPGGCIVEGRTLAVRYQWKKTIGDICDRETIINRWNTEFRHRLTPDYFQSFGLGFYEYFLLSETIGAEPMPIINCGMACQFNTGETAAVDKLGPYVQDALDLIEFANGSASSRWGKIRAEMGHPEPFNLKYLGVGNEQWGPQYIERYTLFEKALKAKYPEVQLIAGCGSDPEIFPNGYAEVKYLWEQYRKLKPDIVDEHFYRRYPWFFEHTDYYDSYDRSGPKIFVGEYAAMTHGVASPENRNNLICALAEAAFLTGMQNNAAVVTMSAYAPLAGHMDGWQWKPNLLWFDNLTSFATPNYYVQQMFSLHRGDVVLPVQADGAEGRFYAVASRDNETGQIILKVVNAEDKAVDAKIRIAGTDFLPPTRAIVLTGRADDENSMQNPKKIAPVEEPLSCSMTGSDDFGYSFRPYSLTVLKTTPKQ